VRLVDAGLVARRWVRARMLVTARTGACEWKMGRSPDAGSIGDA
jgi:hypothetical protein